MFFKLPLVASGATEGRQIWEAPAVHKPFLRWRSDKKHGWYADLGLSMWLRDRPDRECRIMDALVELAAGSDLDLGRNE